MAGPVWVEDDSIGRALAGLSDSFSGKGGAYIANVRSEIAAREDQRRKLQLEMEREQEKQAAQNAAIAAERARQMAMPAPTPAQTGWATGAGRIGTEVVPPGGPAPLQAYDAADVGQRDAAAARTFNLERDKQLADQALGVRYAQSMGDVAKSAPQMAGMAQVAEYGVPRDPQAQLTLQTQLKGEIPAIDKATGNWAEVDAQGNPVPGSGGMLTADGRDAATGRPPMPKTPGGRIMKAGEVKAGGAGIFENEGAMRQATFQLARKAMSGGLQPDEEAQLKFVSRFVFPWAQDVQKNAQGQFVLISKQKEEPPQLLTDALAKLDQTAAAPGGTPADQAFTQGAPPIPQVPGVTPLAGATQAAPGGGMAGPGFKMSAAFGPSEASPEALRKEASSATLASNAMNEFYKKFGYSGRDPATGAPGQFADPAAVRKTVPGLMSAAVSEYGGTSILGQAAANRLDPKAQEYNALAYRFVEPVIRMASGAAISPREYSQYFSMFIPNANDSPLTASQKLDAMRDWVDAVSGATTARGALDRMSALATNPMTRQAVEQMRVRATEAGTLDKPFAQVDKAAAPTAAAAPAAQAAPAGETRTIGNRNYRRDPTTGKWFEVQ